MIKALLAPLSLCGKMQCEERGQERKRGNALSYSSPDRRIQMAGGLHLPPISSLRQQRSALSSSFAGNMLMAVPKGRSESKNQAQHLATC